MSPSMTGRGGLTEGWLTMAYVKGLALTTNVVEPPPSRFIACTVVGYSARMNWPSDGALALVPIPFG